MNCDQVFDILTRGPFPAGQPTDEAVERHLSACHECRQLAEALRPAVELFHESIEPIKAAELPGYQGALFEPTGNRIMVAVQTAIARDAAISHRTQSTRRVSPRTQIAFWRFAAALLAAVAVCALFWGVARPRPSADIAQQDKLRDVQIAAQFQPDEDGARLLAMFQLPAHCIELNDASMSSAPTDRTASVHHCCTRCHHAGSAIRPPLEAMAVLATSCQACHEF